MPKILPKGSGEFWKTSEQRSDVTSDGFVENSGSSK